MKGRPRRTLLKKAGRIAAAVLVALALASALWLLGARLLAKEEPPSLFGYAPLTVLSGSMEPALSAGDLVVIHRAQQYETGEIITFAQRDGVLVTHRIVAQEAEGYRTQGDANNTPDEELVTLRQIKGRVVWTIPYLGKAMLFLRTPGGLLLMLGLGLALLFWPERRKKTHRDREEEAT